MRKKHAINYFEWLCEFAGRYETYSTLFDWLHADFVCFDDHFVPNDDNRLADGKHLRGVYLDTIWDGHYVPSPFVDECREEVLKMINTDMRCSYLEFFVGLAHRLEWEFAGYDNEPSVSECFWILLDNIGLSKCTNMWFGFEDGSYLEDVLNVFEQRGYDYDGTGGLFPLRCPKKDQRRVEIWYQMNDWIVENRSW